VSLTDTVSLKFAGQSATSHDIVAPELRHTYLLFAAGYAPPILGFFTPILTTTGVNNSALPLVAINYAVPSFELAPNIWEIILSTGR